MKTFVLTIVSQDIQFPSRKAELAPRNSAFKLSLEISFYCGISISDFGHNFTIHPLHDGSDVFPSVHFVISDDDPYLFIRHGIVSDQKN